jgi:hypothetical protein
MVVPPVAFSREIDKNLYDFFRSHRPISFRRAISGFCRYYHLRLPRIEWYEYIDYGKTAGKTYEDGRIHLIHPENWKRCRIHKSERQWIQTLYHEMGHFVFWTDAERKADAFQRRMVLGLRAQARRTAKASRGSKPASKPGLPTRRKAAARGRRDIVSAQGRRSPRSVGAPVRPKRRRPASRLRRG